MMITIGKQHFDMCSLNIQNTKEKLKQDIESSLPWVFTFGTANKNSPRIRHSISKHMIDPLVRVAIVTMFQSLSHTKKIRKKNIRNNENLLSGIIQN